MSDVITMDRDMLTEVMAQAIMRANQQMFGLPSRAAGEQSNILNFTEYYKLPLPTGNEVIAYQDFINDANNIIDGALHGIQNTLDTVSTTANNAEDGVAAADTKIEELVQANVDNEVASLPQFKQDTALRLENLEDDVNGLSGWTGGWLDSETGEATNVILTSSIGTLFIGSDESVYEQLTEPLKNFLTEKNISSSSNSKCEICKKAGNVFNLPDLNVFYVITDRIFGKSTTGDLLAGSTHLGVKWTGTETVFAMIDAFATGTRRIVPITFLPMTPKKNTQTT